MFFGILEKQKGPFKRTIRVLCQSKKGKKDVVLAYSGGAWKRIEGRLGGKRETSRRMERIPDKKWSTGVVEKTPQNAGGGLSILQAEGRGRIL